MLWNFNHWIVLATLGFNRFTVGTYFVVQVALPAGVPGHTVEALDQAEFQGVADDPPPPRGACFGGHSKAPRLDLPPPGPCRDRDKSSEHWVKAIWLQKA